MTLSQSLAFWQAHRAVRRSAGSNAVLDLHRSGNVNRGGKCVVGALPHVDVVVGMNRLLLGHPVATGDLDRTVADHFVDVHVAAGAATGLKHIDRKLIGQACRRRLRWPLAASPSTCASIERVFAAAGQFSEVSIGHAAGILHQSHRRNHRWRQSPSADRKVFDRTLGLGTVVGIGGNMNLAHRVAFSSEVGHGLIGLESCWGRH